MSTEADLLPSTSPSLCSPSAAASSPHATTSSPVPTCSTSDSSDAASTEPVGVVRIHEDHLDTSEDGEASIINEEDRYVQRVAHVSIVHAREDDSQLGPSEPVDAIVHPIHADDVLPWSPGGYHLPRVHDVIIQPYQGPSVDHAAFASHLGPLYPQSPFGHHHAPSHLHHPYAHTWSNYPYSNDALEYVDEDDEHEAGEYDDAEDDDTNRAFDAHQTHVAIYQEAHTSCADRVRAMCTPSLARQQWLWLLLFQMWEALLFLGVCVIIFGDTIRRLALTRHVFIVALDDILLFFFALFSLEFFILLKFHPLYRREYHLVLLDFIAILSILPFIHMIWNPLVDSLPHMSSSEPTYVDGVDASASAMNYHRDHSSPGSSQNNAFHVHTMASLALIMLCRTAFAVRILRFVKSRVLLRCLVWYRGVRRDRAARIRKRAWIARAKERLARDRHRRKLMREQATAARQLAIKHEALEQAAAEALCATAHAHTNGRLSVDQLPKPAATVTDEHTTQHDNDVSFSDGAPSDVPSLIADSVEMSSLCVDHAPHASPAPTTPPTASTHDGIRRRSHTDHDRSSSHGLVEMPLPDPVIDGEKVVPYALSHLSSVHTHHALSSPFSIPSGLSHTLYDVESPLSHRGIIDGVISPSAHVQKVGFALDDEWHDDSDESTSESEFDDDQWEDEYARSHVRDATDVHPAHEPTSAMSPSSAASPAPLQQTILGSFTSHQLSDFATTLLIFIILVLVYVYMLMNNVPYDRVAQVGLDHLSSEFSQLEQQIWDLHIASRQGTSADILQVQYRAMVNAFLLFDVRWYYYLASVPIVHLSVQHSAGFQMNRMDHLNWAAITQANSTNLIYQVDHDDSYIRTRMLNSPFFISLLPGVHTASDLALLESIGADLSSLTPIASPGYFVCQDESALNRLETEQVQRRASATYTSDYNVTSSEWTSPTPIGLAYIDVSDQTYSLFFFQLFYTLFFFIVTSLLLLRYDDQIQQILKPIERMMIFIEKMMADPLGEIAIGEPNRRDDSDESDEGEETHARTYTHNNTSVMDDHDWSREADIADAAAERRILFEDDAAFVRAANKRRHAGMFAAPTAPTSPIDPPHAEEDEDDEADDHRSPSAPAGDGSTPTPRRHDGDHSPNPTRPPHLSTQRHSQSAASVIPLRPKAFSVSRPTSHSGRRASRSGSRSQTRHSTSVSNRERTKDAHDGHLRYIHASVTPELRPSPGSKESESALEQVASASGAAATAATAATPAAKSLVPSTSRAHRFSNEASTVEKSLLKLALLLQVGFGVAGSNIISTNLVGGDMLDPMQKGRKMFAIFGFCDLKPIVQSYFDSREADAAVTTRARDDHMRDEQTTSFLIHMGGSSPPASPTAAAAAAHDDHATSESFIEQIMVFINQLQAIVHGETHKYGGFINSSIGSNTLMAWKFDLDGFERNERQFGYGPNAYTNSHNTANGYQTATATTTPHLSAATASAEATSQLNTAAAAAMTTISSPMAMRTAPATALPSANVSASPTPLLSPQPRSLTAAALARRHSLSVLTQASVSSPPLVPVPASVTPQPMVSTQNSTVFLPPLKRRSYSITASMATSPLAAPITPTAMMTSRRGSLSRIDAIMPIVSVTPSASPPPMSVGLSAMAMATISGGSMSAIPISMSMRGMGIAGADRQMGDTPRGVHTGSDVTAAAISRRNSLTGLSFFPDRSSSPRLPPVSPPRAPLGPPLRRSSTTGNFIGGHQNGLSAYTRHHSLRSSLPPALLGDLHAAEANAGGPPQLLRSQSHTNHREMEVGATGYKDASSVASAPPPSHVDPLLDGAWQMGPSELPPIGGVIPGTMQPDSLHAVPRTGAMNPIPFSSSALLYDADESPPQHRRTLTTPIDPDPPRKLPVVALASPPSRVRQRSFTFEVHRDTVDTSTEVSKCSVGARAQAAPSHGGDLAELQLDDTSDLHASESSAVSSVATTPIVRAVQVRTRAQLRRASLPTLAYHDLTNTYTMPSHSSSSAASSRSHAHAHDHHHTDSFSSIASHPLHDRTGSTQLSESRIDSRSSNAPSPRSRSRTLVLRPRTNSVTNALLAHRPREQRAGGESIAGRMRHTAVDFRLVDGETRIDEPPPLEQEEADPTTTRPESASRLEATAGMASAHGATFVTVRVSPPTGPLRIQVPGVTEHSAHADDHTGGASMTFTGTTPIALHSESVDPRSLPVIITPPSAAQFRRAEPLLPITPPKYDSGAQTPNSPSSSRSDHDDDNRMPYRRRPTLFNAGSQHRLDLLASSVAASGDQTDLHEEVNGTDTGGGFTRLHGDDQHHRLHEYSTPTISPRHASHTRDAASRYSSAAPTPLMAGSSGSSQVSLHDHAAAAAAATARRYSLSASPPYYPPSLSSTSHPSFHLSPAMRPQPLQRQVSAPSHFHAHLPPMARAPMYAPDASDANDDYSPDSSTLDSLVEDPTSPHNDVTRAFLRMSAHPFGRTELTRMASQALLAFCKTLVKVASDASLDRWRQYPLLRPHLTGIGGVAEESGGDHPQAASSVGLRNRGAGMGLHIGWAIEGAIGSKHKIDATYLSPNVNLASRLAAATRQYFVAVLISQQFYKLLPQILRDRCRHVDRVILKGSAKPMSMYTFDIFIDGEATTATTISGGSATATPMMDVTAHSSATTMDGTGTPAGAHARTPSRGPLGWNLAQPHPSYLSVPPVPSASPSPPPPSTTPTIAPHFSLEAHVHASLDHDMAKMNSTRRSNLTGHHRELAFAPMERSQMHMRRRSSVSQLHAAAALHQQQVELSLLATQQQQYQQQQHLQLHHHLQLIQQQQQMQIAAQQQELDAVYDVPNMDPSIQCMSPTMTPPTPFDFAIFSGGQHQHAPDDTHDAHAPTTAASSPPPPSDHRSPLSLPVRPPPTSLTSDPILQKLLFVLFALQQQPPHPLFILTHNHATHAYVHGDWHTARQLYEQVLQWHRTDGPARVVLEFMATHDYQAPADWNGYRKLDKK